MDISFSNVLEGARQYFQGLPAATASTGSPSTTTQQQNQQNQQQQNQHHQQQQNQRQQQQNQHPPPQNHQQKPQIQQNQSRTHLQHLTQQIPQRVQQHHHLPQQHQQQRQHHQHLQQQRIQQQQQQQRLQQHQQQRLQQQHHQQQHRDSDGSVRSEQHSAVPYWDQQQNEGQGTHLPNNSMVPPQQKQNYYGSQYQSYYEVQSKSQQPPQQNQTPVSSYNYPNQQNHTYPNYPTTNNSFSSPISYNYKVYSQQPNYYQDYRGGQQRTYQSSEANQYYPSNSYPNQNYVQKTTPATQNYPAKSTNQQKMMVVKQKRESPLDLSVKTVKTSADSTLLDYEDRKYRSLQYPQQQQIRAPKVDFLPNFSSTPQPKYYNYAPTTSTSLPRMDFPVKNSQDYIPPEKIPKMEPWRQTIDQQIEQKLSAYSKSHEYLNRPKVPQQLPPQQLPPQKANKKVLSILRTSLQNKGARKLEQEQLIQRQIQQPSTDVMAPLQPKPGIVGRRNISPFTAASLERTSNTPPYKLCIPKAIDSIIYEKKDATDLDGLAAFLAARIRTKAELKQVEETVNNNSSPPKLLQPKVRTEIRSSSETSVFDFPDSDNETERQSLGEMRKDRKTVPNQIQLPPSPSDDMFNKTCDSFMEQLRSPKKARKKKNKTRSDSDSDAPLIQLKVKEGNTDTEEVDERKENWGVEEKPVVPNWEEEEDKKPELVPHWEEEKKPDVQNWEEDKKPEIIPQWEEEKKEDWSEDKKPDITNWEENKKLPTWEEDVKPTILITKPAKKPTFGDGSDFQPGWEEDLYKYKKSLRMPRTLIQINRPPNTHRLSTSLPDLDPYPISPSNCDSKKDSDLESNCSYANDSEGSLKNSILDKLLERYGGKKRKRLKNDPPKTIQPPKTSLIRILKEKATIREVFGEDRPASAPPITCLDDLDPKGKENDDVWSKQPVVKTPDKKRGKRKFSSGFDYIRKKKKAVKKEDTGEENKAKKRGNPTKTTPGSVQDIQKEIKMWVLNKGVGETHLHRASRSGFTDITAYCLEKMACSPSPRDNAGYTPLHEACSKGHLDIARLLLQYGAAVSESAQGGIRPLHEAAENGYVEIVRLLLSYGADPTLATYSGITPIQLAVDKSEQTVTLLQQHLDELQGKGAPPWRFNGPADFFDDVDVGYDPLEDPPETDPLPVEEDIEMEVSEQMLPNLYALPDCDTDRWVLLQDLSNLLKIKSKETLLRQLNSSASSSSSADRGSDIKEMKTAEFLETARCCQFLHANEKLNTRSAKILLVKYTEKVKRLLNVEDVVINVR